MKKFYFLAALVAGTALTSCTSEDDLALSPPEVNNVEDGYAPIVFSSVKNNITRADVEGAAAASLLNNKFVVSGFKGDATANPGSMVFDNYSVVWEENSAHTSESNSSNWEYVDKALIPHAIANGITKQTIKYWDYSQTQYDFIAWSTGQKTAIYEMPSDGIIPANNVLVSNIRPNSIEKSWETGNLAYTFTGKAQDLRECYIADLVTVNKGDAGQYGEASGYGQPVTLKFRQLGTKVRIALYETVPGYSVKNVQFYTAAAVNLDDQTKDNAHLFTTTANQIFTEGTYTVSFPTVDHPDNADNNQAHITFEPIQETVGEGNNATTQDKAQATTVSWGGLNYTIAESGEKGDNGNMKIYLGRTSNTASFAGSADENYYQVFLPNQDGTNLNLRVNYTLESIDGNGEIIEVKGATAQVPLIYTQWKPGYAYTYLFKISDKTNGHTGIYDPLHPDDTTINSDPAGLFPITFDAVVVNAEEDKTQETITLVSTPSITTYQNGSKVVNKNEYTVLNSTDPKITGEIYVTVNDGSTGSSYEEVQNLETGDDVSQYYTQQQTYTACGENAEAEAGVTYYAFNNNVYEPVTNINTGDDVSAYYVEGESTYIPCAANATADGSTTYYKMSTKLENGALQELTNKVKLYIVRANTTEAEVIDALQYQDEDLDGYTVMGRNGVGLTEAKDANETALLIVTDEVTYGVDGNKIDVSTGKAAKFQPAEHTTYAFVYTKTEPTGNPQELFQVIGADDFDDVATKYRYGYKSATAIPEYTQGNSTTSYHDAQKGVKYYSESDGVYTLQTPFIGQGVSNLYLDDQGSTVAKGYAVSGVTYYYTVDGGQHYIPAVNVNYADFGDANVHDIGTGNTEGSWEERDASLGTPADNTAYYKRTGTAGNYTYTYCVFLPQQTNGWFELDTGTKVEADETTPVAGQTYFDKYTKNNGEYYTKVIKVE